MKRKIFLILFLFFFLFVHSTNAETITGDATRTVGFNITVISSPPTITLLNPENKTYISNDSLILNFTVGGGQAIWYHINGSSNTTITSQTQFNTSEGSNTLYLIANNSNGDESQVNITFVTNTTLFTPIYTEYSGIYKGSSSDFFRISYNDLQKLTNITLQHILFGRINFNVTVNVTDDDDFSDKQINLDTNVNISFNRIELKSNIIGNFNKSATLELYDLTFTNPRILIDDTICPSSICTTNKYSDGNLSFNVTSFSIYTTDETPSTTTSTTTTPSTTSEGGIGGIRETPPFEINIDKLNISLKKEDTTIEYIEIKNIVNNKINISLSTNLPENLIHFNKSSFSLSRGESKIIPINFSADADENVYTGKILIKSGRFEKAIPTSFEIKSINPSFDVKISLPINYQIIQGENLIVNISIFELEEIGETYVRMEYKIINTEGKSIFRDIDRVKVNKIFNYLKTIKIPHGTKEGEYLFYAQIKYNDNISSDSKWFQVIVGTIERNIGLIAIIVSVILILIVMLITHFISRKRNYPA